ncbi:hypothetical protein DUI87_06237 [Hirundo rustica rustica]|uniref:ribonuclease H n=1 Tax=Hirundo rustica rustica TaxID=333673 RepID=A0A3M0L1T2_HIRRU|nr:hypothetical protein DUI87_06237 [Hirundo rustica rustica]
MQQEEKEEEEREEEEGWGSSRKRRRSSERRHHVHPSLSGSAAPWRRQHRPHRIPQRFARAAGSKNNNENWGSEFGDLKDVFFCLPLHEASQKIFAFEWESPKIGRKLSSHGVLPQGYKNSPTKFGEQLAKDLESWEPPLGEGQLRQYVDDLLIATQTQETCVDWTVSLLNFLGLQGYRVSQKKAQRVRQTVIYLEVSEQDDVEIVVANIVNPASFLSGSTGEPVIHECLETIEATYSSRQDLKDTPLEDAETCLLMEAAMSSVEEDMLELEDAAIVAALTSLSKAYGLVLRDTSFANRISSHLIFHTVLLLLLIDNLIPSHGKMSRSSFEWIDQPDSGAGPV